MSKTLTQLLGSSATFANNRLKIHYHDLIGILGYEKEQVTRSPTPEGLVATLLLALNKTTRLSLDENGFPIPNNQQSIVSPNIEPRRGYVTRGDDYQVQTRLSFEIYTFDYNKFTPGKVLDGDY